jgi:hypothetical protein
MPNSPIVAAATGLPCNQGHVLRCQILVPLARAAVTAALAVDRVRTCIVAQFQPLAV